MQKISFNSFFESWNEVRKDSKVSRMGEVSKADVLDVLKEHRLTANEQTWKVFTKDVELIKQVKGTYKFYISQVEISEEKIKEAHKLLYPSFYKEEKETPCQQIISQKTLADYADAELIQELSKRGYTVHRMEKGYQWVHVPMATASTSVEIITKTVLPVHK